MRSKSSLISRKRKYSIRLVPKKIINRIFTIASKREKLIFTTLTLTGLMLTTAFSVGLAWFVMLGVLTASVVGLVLYALWEDFSGIRYWVIPIFPAIFTISVVLNFRVIPLPPVLEFFFVLLYGVTMYLILLISNILNISASRTIPLIRAAHAASFFLNIVLIFLLMFFLATLHTAPLVIFLAAGLISFLPSMYLYWSFALLPRLNREVLLEGITTSIILAETAFVLAMWPVSPLLYALFLTTVFYFATGILHQTFLNRLTRRVIIEYTVVIFFALFLLLFTAEWS